MPVPPPFFRRSLVWVGRHVRCLLAGYGERRVGAHLAVSCLREGGLTLFSPFFAKYLRSREVHLCS